MIVFMKKKYVNYFHKEILHSSISKLKLLCIGNEAILQENGNSDGSILWLLYSMFYSSTEIISKYS